MEGQMLHKTFEPCRPNRVAQPGSGGSFSAFRDWHGRRRSARGPFIAGHSARCSPWSDKKKPARERAGYTGHGLDWMRRPLLRHLGGLGADAVDVADVQERALRDVVQLAVAD